LASGKARGCPCRGLRESTIPRGRARVGSSRELAGSSGSLESLVPLEYRAARTDDRVSGSLAYPAPPMTFGRRRPGSPGDSRHAHLPRPKPRKGNPRDLCLSFRALVKTPEPPCVGSSSPGILLPAADVPPARPLRGAEAPVGPAPPGADLVPPSWFRTTSTVFSALELWVCCTPQPAEGSPRFVLTGPRGVARRLPPLAGIPAVRFAPSEEFPSSAAGHASLRAIAFLPLPSCPVRAPTEAGARADRHPR